MHKGFTLLELIVVIVILGILATLGYTQYDKQVESTRLAEAKVTIGSMRQLATEYYWKNGSLNGIQNSDVGMDNACTSTSFFRYLINAYSSTSCYLQAYRCISGGKTPNAAKSYNFYMIFTPATGGDGVWRCHYDDPGYPSCLGLPS